MLEPSEESGGVFRGTTGRLLHAFFKEHLAKSATYHRAAGFFSSSVFLAADKEFVEFFGRGGSMELICSPVIGLQDIKAMQEGLYDERYWRTKLLEQVAESPRAARGTSILSWSLAHRRLDIRVAVVASTNPQAIYHEKIGIFVTRDGTPVAFEGSANESANAYVENFERIVVHHPDSSSLSKRASGLIRENFESLWRNQTPNVEVIPLHEALKRRLVQPRRATMDLESLTSGQAIPDAKLSVPPEILRRPSRLLLRPYQEQAIDSWLRGYPVTFPCNSRYLKGTGFLDVLGFKSLSIR